MQHDIIFFAQSQIYSYHQSKVFLVNLYYKGYFMIVLTQVKTCKVVTFLTLGSDCEGWAAKSHRPRRVIG